MLVAARPRERMLFGACVLLILAAFAVMLVRSGGLEIRAVGREEGALRAPATDSQFTQSFGEPAAPLPEALEPSPNAPSTNGSTPDAGPEKPGSPPPTGAEEPPPEGDEGLLGFLPDLPILRPILERP